MRPITIALIVLLGLVAVACLALVADFWGKPVQPAHPAMARVVAIAAWEAKFRASRDTIVIRNSTGTGQFILNFDQVKCRVGDVVPVEQRGITLRPTAKTCR